MNQQIATVKKIVDIWEKGGIQAVKIFLSDSKIYEQSWSEKIKKLLDQNLIKTAEAEIELVSFNIHLETKLYKNKKDEEGKNPCNCN